MDRKDVLAAILKLPLQVLKLGETAVSEIPVVSDLAEGILEEIVEKIGPYLKNYKKQIPDLVREQMARKNPTLQDFIIAAAEFYLEQITPDSLVEGKYYEAWAAAVEKAKSYTELQKHLGEEERAALNTDLPMVLAKIIEEIQKDCLEDKEFLNRVLDRLSNQVNETAALANSHEKCLARHESRLDCHDQRLEELEAKDHSSSCQMKEKLSDFAPARNPFVYNAENIGFYGRSEQIEALKAFCEANGKIRFWAVTGAGGSGKSRLAYEFAREMVQKDWTIRVLRRENYARLTGERPEQNTVYIADYVQGHLEQLGSWICELEESETEFSGKVRILLLEREGTAISDSLWMKQMEQAVSGFGNDFSADCYAENWIQLQPMEKAELQDAMSDFYRAQTGQELSDPDREYLYTALLQVDKTLHRPLFALFITDAFLRGEAPEKWDQKSTLDILYRKECGILQEKIRGIPMEVNTHLVWTHLARVYAAVTVYGESTVKILQAVFPQTWKNFLSTLPEPREETAWELLTEIGLLDRDSEKLHPLEPDLFGEYFVLCQLEEPGCRRPIQKELAANFHELPVFLFFDRVLRDYPDRLKKLSWLIQELLHTKYTSKEWETYIPLLHAFLLVNLTLIQTAEERKKTVEVIQSIHESHLDCSKVTVAYAQSLSNLSNSETGFERRNTVELLQKLSDWHHNLPEVTEAYAMSLFNLSCKQTGNERKNTVELLRKLSDSHQALPKVIDAYASSLFNLSFNQSGDQRRNTVELLRKLSDSHHDLPEVTEIYARLLLNLSFNQTGDEQKNTVEQLQKLHEAYPEISEVTKEYTYALFYLMENLSQDDRPIIFRMAEKLYKEAPTEDTAEVYAVAGVGLLESFPERKKEIKEIVDLLRVNYPENDVIALSKDYLSVP